MKQKILVLSIVLTFASSLLLSACGAKPVAESSEPSATPSPIVVSPTPSVEATQYPLIVKAGNSVTVDLNGDGKEDEVYYEPDEDTYSILHLSVNGTDYAGSVYDQEFYSDNLEGAYCITNIDASDNMLEIAIMDYGPSDDCITSFFRYDGNDLIYLGNVSGLIASSYSDKSDLTFNGDGTISSYVRLSVMQTWFANVDWQLADTGRFEVVPTDLYYPTSESGCDVTALADIYLYVINSDSSAKTVLTAGAALKLIATDNLQWVLAETSDGKECWIHLDSEYGQMVETTDGYKYSSEVFSGLCIAD
ncbi:MAG: hypothetical protein CVU91_05630 [Firmicutes bacterium HGW-Firmicutes-16]|nr:MAG: hypothetical protein CVU91_05630 [Firmicutes bacterium HGW-Firmicutes-16]